MGGPNGCIHPPADGDWLLRLHGTKCPVFGDDQASFRAHRPSHVPRDPPYPVTFDLRDAADERSRLRMSDTTARVICQAE